jgi:hypothetical protein
MTGTRKPSPSGLVCVCGREARSFLIVQKPALFIEKLAKCNSPLDVERICNYEASFELPGINWEVILERRIDALAALNLPKYQELIDRCIGYIEKKLTEKK